MMGLAFATWAAHAVDPAPSVFRSRKKVRSYECERLVGEAARERLPDRIREERPRGNYVEQRVLHCRQRWMRTGLRHPRDEAVLSDLRSSTAAVASQAVSVFADFTDRTWLVETFFVNPAVSSKVGFAAKAALMTQGVTVSDRVPLLSASDVEVLLDLPPSQAYPAACLRWHATGQLRDDDVLLALVTRDRRETIYHAGVCTRGRWTWLQ